MITLYRNTQNDSVGAYNSSNGVSQRLTQNTLPKLAKLLGLEILDLSPIEIKYLKTLNKGDYLS